MAALPPPPMALPTPAPVLLQPTVANPTPRSASARRRSLRRRVASILALYLRSREHFEDDISEADEDAVSDVIISVPVPTPAGLHLARLATFPVRPYRGPSAAESRLPPADLIDAAEFRRRVAAENAQIVGGNKGGNGGVAAEASTGSVAHSCDGCCDGESVLLGKPKTRETTSELLKLGASRECMVCLCDFNEGELLRLLLPCGHRFHVSCIDHWLAERTTCPVCRTNLNAAAGDHVAESGVTVKKVESLC